METSDKQERIDRMVNEGIGKIAKLTITGNTVAIDWQPGDGMRYVMFIQRLPAEIMNFVGGSDAHVFVSWIDGSRTTSHAFIDGNIHTSDYVAEKFRLNGESSTACFLSALLNLLTGNFNYGHGQYAAGKERWT